MSSCIVQCPWKGVHFHVKPKKTQQIPLENASLYADVLWGIDTIRLRRLHTREIRRASRRIAYMRIRYKITNWRVCWWRLDGPHMYVFPSHASHTHHQHRKKMRGVLNVQVIEDHRICAMLFLHDTNSSNAPRNKISVCSLFTLDECTDKLMCHSSMISLKQIY